jgi:hypothetical protein
MLIFCGGLGATAWILQTWSLSCTYLVYSSHLLHLQKSVRQSNFAQTKLYSCIKKFFQKKY